MKTKSPEVSIITPPRPLPKMFSCFYYGNYCCFKSFGLQLSKVLKNVRPFPFPSRRFDGFPPMAILWRTCYYFIFIFFLISNLSNKFRSVYTHIKIFCVLRLCDTIRAIRL